MVSPDTTSCARLSIFMDRPIPGQGTAGRVGMASAGSDRANRPLPRYSARGATATHLLRVNARSTSDDDFLAVLDLDFVERKLRLARRVEGPLAEDAGIGLAGLETRRVGAHDLAVHLAGFFHRQVDEAHRVVHLDHPAVGVTAVLRLVA